LFFWHETQQLFEVFLIPRTGGFLNLILFFQIPRPSDSFDFEIVSNIWNQRLVDSDFFNTRNRWVLLKSITHNHIGPFLTTGPVGPPKAPKVHPRPGLGTLVKSTNTVKKSSNYPNTTKVFKSC
jgi:hypothetical protein